MTADRGWAPEACTLPTADQPPRLAEFDELAATALRAQQRVSPTTLRWELDPAAEDTARALTGRESRCCSFFGFTFQPAGAVLRLDITVPHAQAEVLDGLQQRAARRIRS